jgi:hypothetical protein
MSAFGGKADIRAWVTLEGRDGGTEFTAELVAC